MDKGSVASRNVHNVFFSLFTNGKVHLIHVNKLCSSFANNERENHYTAGTKQTLTATLCR